MDYDYTKYSRGDRIFRIIYSLMRIPMGIFYNVKVFNRNKIPYQDGFIIASNHCDSTDQYKLGIAIGNRPFVGFAAKEIKNTFRGKLFDFTGVTIGNNVIIGAGSVVNRDIEDNSIAVGNPAKVIKKLEAEE